MHLQPCCGRKGPSFGAAKEFLSTGKSNDGAKIIAEDAQATDVGKVYITLILISRQAEIQMRKGWLGLRRRRGIV
jgi:hypothetical protein